MCVLLCVCLCVCLLRVSVCDHVYVHVHVCVCACVRGNVYVCTYGNMLANTCTAFCVQQSFL